MKITVQQLRRIIKEEVKRSLYPRTGLDTLGTAARSVNRGLQGPDQEWISTTKNPYDDDDREVFRVAKYPDGTGNVFNSAGVQLYVDDISFDSDEVRAYLDKDHFVVKPLNDFSY